MKGLFAMDGGKARHLIQRMARLLLLAAVPGVALAAPASTRWTGIDPARSSLAFVVKEMGVAVDGHFNTFTATLDFDPAHPETGKAGIVLDVGSVDAGSEEANGEVVGKAWFDVKNHPQARFDSTVIRALGGGRFEAAGRLQVKGRTQDIVVPFTFAPQGRNAQVDGAFTIRRADFAVGEGEWADFGTVGNEIQIRFRFLATAGK